MHDIRKPPIRWPKGNKSAACFTFDLDAETHWLSKDPANINRPGVLSMGKYGPTIGVPLLLDLLRRHKIKSTFFVPGWTAKAHPDAVQAIVERNHEIAHHGYLHESLEGMTRQKEEAILRKGLDILGRFTSSPIVGYRSPSWDLTPHTLDLLKKYKFSYASNMMDSLWPYRHATAPDIIELPVQWLLDDGPFFAYGMRPPLYRQIYSPEMVYSMWKEEFVGMHKLGAIYNLTMHPQFIGRPSRIKILDRLIRFIKNKKVWIATCGEIARHAQANLKEPSKEKQL